MCMGGTQMKDTDQHGPIVLFICIIFKHVFYFLIESLYSLLANNDYT